MCLGSLRGNELCPDDPPLQSQLAEVTDALALRQSFQDFIAPHPMLYMSHAQ